MKGYNVKFVKQTKGWFWILFYGDKYMAKSHRGYATETNATRAFWRIFNEKTIEQIENNYAEMYQK